MDSKEKLNVFHPRKKIFTFGYTELAYQKNLQLSWRKGRLKSVKVVKFCSPTFLFYSGGFDIQ